MRLSENKMNQMKEKCKRDQGLIQKTSYHLNIWGKIQAMNTENELYVSDKVK